MLRAEVESLLLHDRCADEIFGPLGEGGQAALRAEVAAAARPGIEIGPYRLVGLVGEGGMGEVWLAEQSVPIRRQVALKLIKSGMDTRQVVSRFEAERQALAVMDHPCIAKVLDAGETSSGRPYFVMEYVNGVPITEYCDTERLSVRDRLALFTHVCEGVQHAHQKGIIHRDLKPQNVLVLEQSGRALPKIIDFGVAKAIGPRSFEMGAATQFGMLIGTLEYMSPEQADATGLDIDTRTDVYALGVILYELLTGALPFQSSELQAAGFDEVRRILRECDPLLPSRRISLVDPDTKAAASQRQTDPGPLRRALKGDLDWITMKALEKDRARRYGSPSEFAADLARHLADEPVLAGPPSAIYRAEKFVRRHRIGVAAGAALAVVLLGSSAITMVQNSRITRERDRANREAQVSERVSAFMTSLFGAPDPDETRGKVVTAREVLDKGIERIETELANEPEVRGRLEYTMGMVYSRLDALEKAEALLKNSVDARRSALGSEHSETLASMNQLGILFQRQRRYLEAEKIHREILAIQERTLGRDDPVTLRTINSIAAACNSTGRFAEAEQLYRDLLQRQRRVLPADQPDLYMTLNNLGNSVSAQGRTAEAAEHYRQACEGLQRVRGPDHPHTLMAMSNVADSYLRAGQLDEAERMHREVLSLRERVLGERHQDTVSSMYSLACVAARRGRRGEALEWLAKAVEHGLDIPDEMVSDVDLQWLHGDATFSQLVAAARRNGPR